MSKQTASKIIKVTLANYVQLKQRGQFGETFNDVITKMLSGK